MTLRIYNETPHTKIFQMIMNKFYDTESATDSDGLYAIKVILNSNQVKEDVRKNYYAASLFLDKVLDSYLLKAAGPDKADDDTGKACTLMILFFGRGGHKTDIL